MLSGLSILYEVCSTCEVYTHGREDITAIVHRDDWDKLFTDQKYGHRSNREKCQSVSLEYIMCTCMLGNT